MPEPETAPTDIPALLDGLRTVLTSPVHEVAPAFSRLISSFLPHAALVIVTEDGIGRPRRMTGDADVVDRLRIAELDALRAGIPPDDAAPVSRTATLGGVLRTAIAWPSETNALLVLVDPAATDETTNRAEEGPGLRADRSPGAVHLVTALWEHVALGIRRQIAVVPTSYLVESRRSSSERARAVAELSDEHASTLESLLAVLRSRSTSDAAARHRAVDLAAGAMVRLRASTDRDRMLREEPVAQAFERLRDDLSPLVRFGDVDVQFVEPPLNGRALPGEVAHAGRAIVRGAVLALVEQPGVSRVRVQWDCDGSNLLIDIRDDGTGEITATVPSVRRLADRVVALDGLLTVDGTAGWGSTIAVSLPLDPPAAGHPVGDEWRLSTREREVLQLVATGARNRSIASTLFISENTVKFHVANLLRKVGASTRSELTAIVQGA